MPDDAGGALPYGTLGAITGDETLLILAPGPADESRACGGLIAESCRRGRPPFVMVLGDGTAPQAGQAGDELARIRDRETRKAVGCLGLANERLLMAGLYDGQIPDSGSVFDAVVRAVTLVMWARDCNVVCAPWPHPGATRGERATFAVAKAVAAGSGVRLLGWADVDWLPDRAGVVQGWRLDIAPWLALKRQALAVHATTVGSPSTTVGPEGERDYEVFLVPAADPAPDRLAREGALAPGLAGTAG